MKSHTVSPEQSVSAYLRDLWAAETQFPVSAGSVHSFKLGLGDADEVVDNDSDADITAGEPVVASAAAFDASVDPVDGDHGVSQSVWTEISGEGAEAPKITRAKGAKNVHSGIVHVYATFNNSIVTITDKIGGVIGWSTSGKMGFRGSRKGTAYAAQVVAQDACRQAMGHGLREVEVRLRGPGAGRASAVRAIQALGVEVSVIKDVTSNAASGRRGASKGKRATD